MCSLKTCVRVHTSTIYNRPKLETTQIPIEDELLDNSQASVDNQNGANRKADG